MALYDYASSSKVVSRPGKSEFDILKESHKFLRDDDGKPDHQLSWDQQLAKKYYSSLYREYAVCDLKHYKSGNFALRWRTESEVISGAGETTCGNTRCSLHTEYGMKESGSSLKTLELPFQYAEAGESKFALVKVVLCDKCCKKLMWKRTKDKGREEQGEGVESRLDSHADDKQTSAGVPTVSDPQPSQERGSSRRHHREHAHHGDRTRALDHTSRRRNSRSVSPSPRQPKVRPRSSQDKEAP